MVAERGYISYLLSLAVQCIPQREVYLGTFFPIILVSEVYS